jgi:hypothetical protein
MATDLRQFVGTETIGIDAVASEKGRWIQISSRAVRRRIARRRRSSPGKRGKKTGEMETNRIGGCFRAVLPLSKKRG